MNVLLLAFAPGIAICLFILHRDAYNKEPKANLFIAFVLGAITVFPAGAIEVMIGPYFDKSVSGTTLTAFFGVSLVEELVKFAVLYFFAFRLKSFDEPLDGIVYAVVIGMGFASLENYLYLDKYGWRLGIMRMLLPVPAHATFGALMGFYAGKAKFDAVNKTKLLVTGLVWAVVFHGLYDCFLFLRESPEIDQQAANGLLFLGAVVSLIVAIRFSLKHLKQHRRLSQQTYNPTETMSLRKAFPNDVKLIRDLSMRIWPTAYGSIISPEQMNYMLDLMYNEDALKKQMSDGQNFAIIYDGVEPIGFTAFTATGPGVYKLNKIYVLPAQQGRGTGKYAIEQLSAAMKAKGGTTLQLNVNRQNKAKEFYEKLGFTIIAEEDIDIGKGFFMNDYIMEKKL